MITIAEVLENKNKDDDEELLKEDEFSQSEKNLKKYFKRPDIQEALKVAVDLAFLQKTNRAISNNNSL